VNSRRKREINENEKKRIQNKKINYLEVLFANFAGSVNLQPRQPINGPRLLEIALKLQIDTISGHCKQPTQYRWIFAISKKNGGFSDFMR
jgi:hypothetical protein